jgi:LmbE family N-acetylglucosaminyl deacetylase
MTISKRIIRTTCAALALGATGAMPAGAQAERVQDEAAPPAQGEGIVELKPGPGPDILLRPRARPDRAPDSGTEEGFDPVDPKMPSVLAILAHPDDEIVMAPILSRIVREGGAVTLVFATSGDAGPGVSDMAPGEELAALRENEARCAAFALGLEEPIFWGFGDGTLANEARNTEATMRDMAERISGLIAIEEPRVVMTWGPDGGYGHADHRMTSNAVTQVVQAMGDERPDLLYVAIPAGPEGEEGDLPGFEGWARIHPSLVTDRIAYELPDLDATIAAVDCYESQFDQTMRRALASLLHQRLWQGTVFFRLAFATAQ